MVTRRLAIGVTSEGAILASTCQLCRTKGVTNVPQGLSAPLQEEGPAHAVVPVHRGIWLLLWPGKSGQH